MDEPAVTTLPRTGISPAVLLANVSLEVSTRRPADVDACRDGFAAGTQVYITSLPGDAPADTARTAAALARAGLVPVPHVAARRLADATAADALLARLAGEAGVTQALVIAGDIDTPSGPFASAASLLASGLFVRHGFRNIGVAGYPEGHPRIADGVLAAALDEELALLDGQGIAAHVVSQFCFEAAPIRRWLAGYAAAGHAAPVRLGIAGPAGLATLTRYALRCGIGSSARALARHGARFTRLAREATPDALLADLAASPLPAIAGIHLFTFGGVERTAAWLAGATAGMAATSPSAVASRASAIPGATTARLVVCASAMPTKLFMMPHTVPNRPTKGAVAPMVASRPVPTTMRRAAAASMRCRREAMRSLRPSRSASASADIRASMAAAAISAAATGVPSSIRPAASARVWAPSTAARATRCRRIAPASSTLLAARTVQVTSDAKARPTITACTTMSAAMNMPQGVMATGSRPLAIAAAAGPGSAPSPAVWASAATGRTARRSTI